MKHKIEFLFIEDEKHFFNFILKFFNKRLIQTIKNKQSKSTLKKLRRENDNVW